MDSTSFGGLYLLIMRWGISQVKLAASCGMNHSTFKTKLNPTYNAHKFSREDKERVRASLIVLQTELDIVIKHLTEQMEMATPSDMTH